MPRLPGESGCSARIARPDCVSSEGLGTISAPHALIIERRARLLLVRDPDHVDLALEADQLARERERAPPLARAGLGREPRPPFLLVVEGLRDRRVRLVAPGRADALVLVEDRASASRSPPRAGARGRAASAARGCRSRAPPPGSRSPAPRSPPGRSAPSGRAARDRPARSAAPCRDAAPAAAPWACRSGCCTSVAGAAIPRAGTSSGSRRRCASAAQREHRTSASSVQPHGGFGPRGRR